jgi:hypothetical protein
VAFGRCYSLPASFFCHWPSFGLLVLIILGGHSSPMQPPFPWSSRSEMVEPRPSSSRARSCSYLPGTGSYRASSVDFLQISIVLHLWPIEPIDGNIAIVSNMRIRIMPFYNMHGSRAIPTTV